MLASLHHLTENFLNLVKELIKKYRWQVSWFFHLDLAVMWLTAKSCGSNFAWLDQSPIFAKTRGRLFPVIKLHEQLTTHWVGCNAFLVSLLINLYSDLRFYSRIVLRCNILMWFSIRYLHEQLEVILQGESCLTRWEKAPRLILSYIIMVIPGKLSWVWGLTLNWFCHHTTVVKIGSIYNVNRGVLQCDQPTPISMEGKIIMLIYVRKPDQIFPQ